MENSENYIYYIVVAAIYLVSKFLGKKDKEKERAKPSQKTIKDLFPNINDQEILEPKVKLKQEPINIKSNDIINVNNYNDYNHLNIDNHTNSNKKNVLAYIDNNFTIDKKIFIYSEILNNKYIKYN